MDLSSLASAATANSAQTDNAISRLSGDFDTFLTLLTTQLQNQDPLEPLDTEQFTQQLVQFAGVEQSIQTNTNLEALIALQSNSDRQASLSLVGHLASVSSNEVTLAPSNAGSSFDFRYSLTSPASSISAQIVDATGTPIASLNAVGDAGTHNVQWDGRLENGDVAPPGTYRLEISARGENETTLAPTIQSQGTVSGVIFGANGPEVLINGRSVSIDQVTRVDAIPVEGR